MNQSLSHTLANFYKDYLHFSSIKAKVYALLLLDYERTGFTFTDLLKETCCSKSTLSNALNALIKSGHIEFYYAKNNRKRYFRVNSSFILIRFNELQLQLKQEMKILNQIISD